MAGSSDRRSRAALRRKTAVLSLAPFAGIERDPAPLSGALSLVERLTRESWTAAGRAQDAADVETLVSQAQPADDRRGKSPDRP